MANMWQGQKYQYIAGNATTTIVTGPGFLHTISTSVPTGSITVHDGTSTGDPVLGVFVANTVSANFVIDCAFGKGLTVVTANSPQTTITYSKNGGST
jgi:hypothetical protein